MAMVEVESRSRLLRGRSPGRGRVGCCPGGSTQCISLRGALSSSLFQREADRVANVNLLSVALCFRRASA